MRNPVDYRRINPLIERKGEASVMQENNKRCHMCVHPTSQTEKENVVGDIITSLFHIVFHTSMILCFD